MHFSQLFVIATSLIGSSLAYSKAASAALEQLADSCNQTTDYVYGLDGCGYSNTTQAIATGAAVTSGSACPSADTAIADRLTSLTNNLQSTVALFKSSRSKSEVSSSQVVADFNSFATAFYSLFNAMDLAECTYVLTPASKSFAIQFVTGNSTTSLKDGFNALIAELSNSFAIAAQIAGANFKQQTHFGGTSFLATQVGGPKPLALAGCELITSIVESEGGGSS